MSSEEIIDKAIGTSIAHKDAIVEKQDINVTNEEAIKCQKEQISFYSSSSSSSSSSLSSSLVPVFQKENFRLASDGIYQQQTTTTGTQTTIIFEKEVYNFGHMPLGGEQHYIYSSPSSSSPLVNIEDIPERVVEFYRKRQTSVMNKSEDLYFLVSDIYTNLTIIGESERKGEQENKQKDQRIPSHENLYQPKQPIPLSDLFQQEKIKNCVKKRALIYGIAGVGKTTLTEKIAIDGYSLWPRQFKAIFVIKLRNLNQDNYLNKEQDWKVEEILAKEHQDSQISVEEFRTFLNDEEIRKQCLLILDGFDELPPVADSGKGALKNIIRDFERMFDHILITSRPATVKFHSTTIGAQTEFEIMGFDQPSIYRYIETFFTQVCKKEPQQAQEKIKNLRLLLKRQPTLQSLAQIPINLTLVCRLFQSNEEIFASIHSFSFTKFYSETVTWLYQRFINRSEISPLIPPTRPDLRISSLNIVADLNHALQLIAWYAMEHNRIQLNAELVARLLETNSGKFRNFEQLQTLSLYGNGIIKFEQTNNSWEFIHLTFQEYFAARYLANLYQSIDSNDLKVAAKYIEKIKFNPRYTLTLWMTAGSLSMDTGISSSSSSTMPTKGPLQFFFDHLHSEPQDLAKSYQLRLFAQCFEQCENPETIKQYPTFINDCVDHINKNWKFAPLLLGLFNHNVNLINHPTIQNCIQNYLRESSFQETMLSVLYALAYQGQIVPDTFLQTLEETRKSFYESKNRLSCHFLILNFFEVIAKQGNRAAISILVGIFHNWTKDNDRTAITNSLVTVLSQEGAVIERDDIILLIEFLNDSQLYGCNRIQTAQILLKTSSQEAIEAAQTVLIKIINDNDHCNLEKRLHAAKILGSVSPQTRIMEAESIIPTLVKFIKCVDYDRPFRVQVPKVLANFSQKGRIACVATLKEILTSPTLGWDTIPMAKVLIEISQDEEEIKIATTKLVEIMKSTDDTHDRIRAAEALINVSQETIAVPQQSIVDALVVLFEYIQGGLYQLKKNIEDPTFDIRIETAKEMGKILLQEGIRFEEIVLALVEIATNNTFVHSDRLDAVQTLLLISPQGKIAAEGAITELLIEIMNDTTLWNHFQRYPDSPFVSEIAISNMRDRVFAAEVLSTVLQQGTEVAEDISSALVEIINCTALAVFDRMRPVRVLLTISQEGKETAKSIVSTLLKNTTLSVDDRIYVAKTLANISLQQGASELIKIANTTEDINAKFKIAEFLVNTSSNREAIEAASTILVELIKNKHLSDCDKVYVAEILCSVPSQTRETQAEAIIPTLRNILKKPLIDINVRIDAAKVLIKLLPQGRPEIDDALTSLAEVFNKSSSLEPMTGSPFADPYFIYRQQLKRLHDVRKKVAKAFVTFSQQEGIVSERFVAILATIINNPTLNMRIAEALADMSPQEGMIPEGTIVALAEIVKNTDLKGKNRIRAATVLVKISPQKGKHLEETINELVKRFTQDDLLTRSDNYSILEAIFTSIKGISINLLIDLMKPAHFPWIIQFLEKIPLQCLQTLAEEANNEGKNEKVVTLCHLTQKAFVILENVIYVSDEHKMISISCSRAIEKSTPIDLNVDQSSSSSSPSSSSLSLSLSLSSPSSSSLPPISSEIFSPPTTTLNEDTTETSKNASLPINRGNNKRPLYDINQIGIPDSCPLILPIIPSLESTPSQLDSESRFDRSDEDNPNKFARHN